MGNVVGRLYSVTKTFFGVIRYVLLKRKSMASVSCNVQVSATVLLQEFRSFAKMNVRQLKFVERLPSPELYLVLAMHCIAIQGIVLD